MKKQLALAVVLATASFGATADELSYNYVDLGYQQSDIDDLGDGDGAVVNASVALGESLHLFGSYARQSAEERLFIEDLDDTATLDIDINTYRIGLGYNHAFNERLDLVVRGAYERQHFDVSIADIGSGDGKADGYSAEVGVRGLLADRFEGWAMAGYADVGSINVEGESIDGDEGDDDQVYGRLGAQFKFNDTWGIVGETRLSDDYNQYSIGLRASF